MSSAGRRRFLDPIARPVERLIYRLTGVDEEHEMRWTEYAVAMLLFSAVSMLVLYAHATPPGRAAIQSAETPRRFARSPGVQHRRIVHDEYQLAGLFAAKPR